MISLRGFCITTLALAVWEFDYVRAHTWTSPVTFYFKPDDNIFVNIILQNVPTEANHYVLYHHTGNCDESTAAQHPTVGCGVPAPQQAPQPRSETLTNRTITIKKQLNKNNVKVFIELQLQKKNDIFCASNMILSGRRDNKARESPFRKDCLNKLDNLCDIIADFGNRCEDLTRAKMYCSQHQLLTCAVIEEELPEDTVHEWYQAYSDGDYIGTIPPMMGSKTEFKMTIHKFDINTYISSIMYSTYWENNLPTEEFKILSATNGYKNYDVKHMKKYIKNEQVSFNCSNNDYTDVHTQIGWIEPTGDIIKTYNETTVSGVLTKDHDGSLLCCLNYHTEIIGTKTTVERTITNITELIYYEEPVNQDNVKGPTESPVPNNTSNDEPPVPGTKASDKSPEPNNKTNDESSVTDGLLTGLAVVVVTAAIVGCVVILHMKKCCRVKSTSEEPPQTYVPRNPFYVNLLFRKECQAEIYAAEHIYEEID